MSDTDQAHEAVERLELHATGRRLERPGFDRRAFLRRTALTGVAAGSVGTLLSACGSSASSSSGGSSSVFGSHPEYKFVVVNHVTTNSFFVPTQYGIQDACKLLGCQLRVDGLGKRKHQPDGQRHQHRRLIGGADGIAVSLISKHRVQRADRKRAEGGHPGGRLQRRRPSPPNKRLAYIGQDLKLAGELMGKRIVAAVGSGDVVIFTASAGLGEPAAAHRRRRKGDQGIGRADQTDHDRDRLAGIGRENGDRSLLDRPPDHEGDVRRRRRRHRGTGGSDAEARAHRRKASRPAAST